MPETVTRTAVLSACDDAGSGRPLLLVHGWGVHAGFFRHQRSALAGHFRVIAPDLRGHRRAYRPGELPTVPMLADDLRALAEALDLREALVVGWSMGALALWRALAEGLAPRVAGMVVIDMTPRVLNGPGWTLGLLGQPPAGPAFAGQLAAAIAAMRADWPGYCPRVARRIFAAGHDAERQALMDGCTAEIAGNDGATMASLWESLTAEDVRHLLPGITTPTLIAHGALSQLYGPATADYLEQTLPVASRLAFASSGHAPHLEEPEAFNRALVRFADALPGRAPASVTVPTSPA